MKAHPKEVITTAIINISKDLGCKPKLPAEEFGKAIVIPLRLASTSGLFLFRAKEV